VQDAQDLNEVADFIWDVDSKSGLSRHTNASLNIVWDLHELGEVMYVAGDFTTLVAPDGTERPQRFLAAFNSRTGAPVPGFNPSLDNVVYSVETNNAGQIVVGGEFDGGVAILDAATGARVTPFDAGISNSWGTPAIYSLKVNGNWVYAGGNFNRAQGSTVDRLVRLDRSTGLLDTGWRPTLEPAIYNGETRELINDIEIDAARNRLYVAGWFDSINGDPETDALAVLNLETGQTAMDHPNIVYDNRDITFLYDAAVDGDTLYYGGKENFTVTANADTFQREGKVAYTNNGDHQVMHVGQNTLWIGCHCWRQAFVAVPPRNPFSPTADAVDTNGLFGIDKVTGEVIQKTFDLRGTAGVWDIEEDQHGRLWAAGQFTRTGGRAVHGLVRFSPATGPASAVQACTAATDGQDTVVTWTGSNTPEFYVVRRSVGAGDSFWRARLNGTERTFRDRNTPANVTYTVEAKVADAVIAPPVVCQTVITSVLAPSACRVTNSNGNLAVSWTRAAGDNATSFVVRRSRSAGPYYWTNRTNAPGTAWTDTGVTSGASYSYTVETHSGAQRSAPTACTPGSIVAGAGQGAVAPISCWATRSGSNVNITWSRANADNSASFVIYRARNGGPFNWVGRVDSPTRAWTNTNPGAGTYAYRVETLSTNGSRSSRDCGPNGGVVIGAAPGADAKAPISCWATRTASGINITWTRAGADNATAFVIRRSRNGGQTYWTGRVDAPTRAWLNTTPGPGTYRYEVEALADNGSRATRTCGPDNGVTV